MGPPNEKGICNSGGSLTLNNVYCNQLVGLFFRIEYKAAMPIDNHNDIINLTLGWCCHLPAIN